MTQEKNKNLYLVRHGSYNPITEELNLEGILEIVNTTKEIKNQLNGLEAISIYHSPIIRAKQSAEVIAENLQPIKSTVIEKEALRLERNKVKEVAEAINDKYAIIVSHGPDLENYLYKLGVYRELPKGGYELVKN